MLEISRNEQCLCGSGRKFERCCLAAVEAASRHLREAVDWERQGFEEWSGIIDFLALAVALEASPEVDSEPLPQVDAVAALRRLLEAFRADDRELINSWHGGLITAFLHDPELRLVRFDPERLGEVTGLALDAGDLADDQGAGDRVIANAVNALVNDDQRDDFALELLLACRQFPGPDELMPLLWGAWCLADPRTASQNPFYTTLCHITLDELHEGEHALEALSNEFAPSIDDPGPGSTVLSEWADRYEEVLNRYPSLRLLVDRRFFRQVNPALDEFFEGRLGLSLPAWTMLGGLLLMLQDGWTMFREGEIDFDQLPFNWHSMAWELDGPVFSPEARRKLQELLPDSFLTDEVREALSTLAETLGPAFVFSQHVAFTAVYASTLTHVWNPDGSLQTGLADPSYKLFLADLADPEEVERYATALEEEGHRHAAEHVRWCVETLGEEG